MEMINYSGLEHRHYPSVEALVDDLGERTYTNPADEELKGTELYDEFYDAGSYEDAVRQALEGRQVKEFKALYQDVSDVVSPKRSIEPIYDVVGGFVDIGAYVSGEPECMVDFTEQEQRGRSITLAIQINDCGDVTSKQLLHKGAVACCVAETLNAMGISTRIILVCWNRMSGGQKSLVTITLADYGKRFDVYMLSGTGGAPNFWRRILFAYLYKYYSNCGASLPEPPPDIFINGEPLTDTYYLGNVDAIKQKWKLNMTKFTDCVKLHKMVMKDIDANHGINYQEQD